MQESVFSVPIKKRQNKSGERSRGEARDKFAAFPEIKNAFHHKICITSFKQSKGEMAVGWVNNANKKYINWPSSEYLSEHK